MEHKLTEAKKEGYVRYYFVEFDDYTDFDKIISTIKEKLKPEKADYEYKGWSAMQGYFIKDKVHVDIQYHEMTGNCMEFKGEQTKENLAKVKGWAELIFNELMAGLKV